MTNLDLLIYVTTGAIILAAIGITGVLYHLYGDSVRSLWTRYMDRGDKSLGQNEKVIVEYEAPDPNDLPPITTTGDVQSLQQELKRLRQQSLPKCGTPDVMELDEKMAKAAKEIMQETYPTEDDEFGMDFLSDKFKEGDKKVANGEISCNLDNPEDCINCGS